MQVVVETEKVMRLDRVQHLADVVVGGNAPDLEQRAGVVAAARLFHGLLRAQEGGALGEKDREGRQPDVGHVKEQVVARAPIGQSGGDRAHPSDEMIEAAPIHGPKTCLYRPEGTSYNGVTMVTVALHRLCLRVGPHPLPSTSAPPQVKMRIVARFFSTLTTDFH